MGKNTKIEYCDSTVNPTTGCDGCELWNHGGVRKCYAGGLHEGRLALALPAIYGKDFREVRLAPGRMKEASRWIDLRGVKREGKEWLDGLRRMIFVGDMGDWLSRAVPDEFIKEEILDAILSEQGERHDWLLLSKRPRRMQRIAMMVGGLPENVIAMTTVTDQRTAGRRLPELMSVDCHRRGVSVEPLFGEVDLRYWLKGDRKLDWVIVGGESGAGAKPLQPEWVRSLRDQCQEAGVAFFFKQWGEWIPVGSGFERVGKKKAGAVLVSREWREIPKGLEVKVEISRGLLIIAD